MKGYNLEFKGLKDCLGKVDHILVIILIIFLAISLYNQQLIPSPHSDGAEYLDLARNAVKNGVFSSNMLFHSSTYANVVYSTGMHRYISGISAIALYFALGNVSLLSAKIMLIFAGSLSIILVYHLCKELLDRMTAVIAAFLLSISPVFLAHVGLVGGPEIVSLLFVLLFMYLTLLSLKHTDSILMPLLAGLSLFLAWYSWTFNFVVIFLGVMPSMFIYSSLKHRELSFRNLLLFSILWGSFLIEYRISLIWTLSFVGVSFPTIILVAVYIVHRFTRARVMKVFLVMILTTYVLHFIFHISHIAIMPLIEQVFAGSDVYSANISSNFGTFKQMFDVSAGIESFSLYWSGLCSALSQTVIFLGIASLIRFRKLKETLLLFSFPFFFGLVWSLMVRYTYFQPRRIVPVSVFWIMLAASSIVFIMSTVSSLNLDKKLVMLLKFREIRKPVNLKSTMSLIACTLLLANVMIFSYPIYNDMTDIYEKWDTSAKYGWDPAIKWIKENTQPDDTLMARSGNYWAWYTDRKTVFFAQSLFGDVNDTQLISLIREFNVNYLIVDHMLYSEFPELKVLYSSSDPFYGSQISFQSSNEQGFKTRIYNVTNIAYGNFVRDNLVLISNCDSEYHWSIFTLYGNGTIEIDDLDRVEGNASIKTVFTVLNRAPNLETAAITLNLPESLDLSNASILQFWVKALFDYQKIQVKLATNETNYFMLVADEKPTQNWTQITMLLGDITAVQRTPQLHSIDLLQIYFTYPAPGKTCIFWIDDILVYSEAFIIGK